MSALGRSTNSIPQRRISLAPTGMSSSMSTTTTTTTTNGMNKLRLSVSGLRTPIGLHLSVLRLGMLHLLSHREGLSRFDMDGLRF